MSAYLIVCLGLVASSPDTLNAEALVRQALECEAKGQYGERHRLLELAVNRTPQPDGPGTARPGQSRRSVAGSRSGRRPRALRRSARGITLPVRRRRAATPGYGLRSLEARPLVRAARAEGRIDCPPDQVTHLDPAEPRGLARLGCRWYHGRWMNQEQITALAAELESQSLADRHWLPCSFAGKPGCWIRPRRDDACLVSFPRSMTRALCRPSSSFSAALPSGSVGSLSSGQDRPPQAAQALAKLAVTAQSSETREAAIRRLRSPGFTNRTWDSSSTGSSSQRVTRSSAQHGERPRPWSRSRTRRRAIERHYRAVSVAPAGGSRLRRRE